MFSFSRGLTNAADGCILYRRESNFLDRDHEVCHFCTYIFKESTSDRMFSGKEETDMKKYEMPEIELKVFALEDVSATSTSDCDNDTGWA